MPEPTTKATFTPPPWKRDGYQVRDASGILIADVFSSPEDESLIAASPDLLAYAMCQRAADMYDLSGNGFTKPMLFSVLEQHGFDGHEVAFTNGEVLSFLRAIRKAAIAKATGETA